MDVVDAKEVKPMEWKILCGFKSTQKPRPAAAGQQGDQKT